MKASSLPQSKVGSSWVREVCANDRRLVYITTNKSVLPIIIPCTVVIGIEREGFARTVRGGQKQQA